MPQGWITRVEKDQGWIGSKEGVGDRMFRHWALAAEMGGRFPAVGSYVQYRLVHDPRRGDYVTEVRKLTPPATEPTTKVYQDNSDRQSGIDRVVDGERMPLEAALRKEAAETNPIGEEIAPGVRRVVGKPGKPATKEADADPPETFTMSFDLGADGTMTETK